MTRTPILHLLAVAIQCLAVALALADEQRLFDKPWRWKDERGSEVSLAQWRGNPLVVAVTYTSCTTRCPIVFGKLHRIETAYTRRNRRVEFVLVTIDPSHDTPEQMAQYKRSHGITADNWHFLSGSESATEALIQFLGVRVIYDDAHIDHETKILIFDRDGKLARTLHGWQFRDDEAVIP
jgi:protein SCO1/2